ncbi:MAG TPA: hypothetical protein VMS71_01455, partial [Candidatus Acidoferrum sp.]|nr:hypothetical protein [Candidatus Acidoferrum sp.]
MRNRISTVGLWRTSVVVSFLAVGSFVWFYPVPLGADMPLHVAVAKAFLDLIGRPTISPYPYILNLKFSSYAAPELILALLVRLFGLASGAKVALTLYAVFFPMAIWYLVGAINPSARWTRLIGFPLTLNFLFHAGYWPTLVGVTFAVFTIALSIRLTDSPRFLIAGAPMRMLTFLMHPAPAVALGLFDVVTVLMTVGRGTRWWRVWKWDWKRMVLLWAPTIICALIMYLGVRGGASRSFSVEWDSIKVQAFQLIRPLYITDNLWEEAVPILMAVVLLVVAGRKVVRERKYFGVLLAALAIMVAGAVIPSRQFFGGSSEIGFRITFVGIVLAASLIAIIEQSASRWISLLVAVALVVNLSVSHLTWSRYRHPFQTGLQVLKDNFSGMRLGCQVATTETGPTVRIGGSLGVWAWCMGYVADAYNGVARTNDFGPVRYIGLDSTAINDGQGNLVYHPYQPGALLP